MFGPPACFPSNEGDSGLGPLPHLLSGHEPSVHTGHLSQALRFRLSSVGRWESIGSGRDTGPQSHRHKWT